MIGARQSVVCNQRAATIRAAERQKPLREAGAQFVDLCLVVEHEPRAVRNRTAGWRGVGVDGGGPRHDRLRQTLRPGRGSMPGGWRRPRRHDGSGRRLAKH